MTQPSAVSVTSFTRKQMASFSLCWHVLINVARGLLQMIIHILFGVTVAVCLAGLLKISFCKTTWRIFLRVSPHPCWYFMGSRFSERGEKTACVWGNYCLTLHKVLLHARSRQTGQFPVLLQVQLLFQLQMCISPLPLDIGATLGNGKEFNSWKKPYLEAVVGWCILHRIA